MKKLLSNLPSVMSWTIALWLGFVAERWYEVLWIDYPGFEDGVKGSYVATGILFDLFAALIITGVFSVFQVIALSVFNKRIAWFFHLLAAMALLANFALIQYFFVAKIPLDESIYFFSLKELQLIAGAGDRFSVGVILLLLGLAAGYITVGLLLRERAGSMGSRTAQVTSLLGILALIASPLACYRNEDKPEAEALINNQLNYFATESLDYFAQSNEGEKGTVSLQAFNQLDPDFLSSGAVDETYPLLHNLQEESDLTALFRKSPKPPHIVLIIVESMSSDLVGVRADKTGHLMPFMDSLSEKGIYFPNLLSTCERTYNVLPAILGSVPNAPNGKMLQQMPYPNMWSLTSLLKKYYYSRFYCGVHLGFCNMGGFMDHVGTDYLVSHWDTKNPAEIDGKQNLWGQPDHVAFKQAFSDQKEQDASNKSRFDIFLTISTHDPYAYPDSKKYTDFVHRQLAKLPPNTKATKRLRKYERDLGAFTYTDASIRAYFEQAKKSPDFENTIFLITGDHGTGQCLFDELSRFKVPLIIYSPLLKKPRMVENVSTHLDITPTLINFLRTNYLPELPEVVPFIGHELDMRPGFHTDRTIMLGGPNCQNDVLFSKGYGLLNGGLYKVDRRLTAVKINNPKKRKELKKQLEYYNLFSRYVLEQDRVIRDVVNRRFINDQRWKVLQTWDFAISQKQVSDEYIDIGDFPTLPDGAELIRIQVSCKAFCNDQSSLKKMPELVASLTNPGSKDRELVTYYGVEPVFEGTLKPNAWNKLTYTIVLRLKDLKRLKRGHEFKFYLYNPEKKTFRMQEIHTELSRNSQPRLTKPHS